MKKADIIREYNDEIRESIIESIAEVARIAIENNTIMQEQVYIWSDGETETLCGPEGDNSFLVAKEHEDRQIYHVATVTGRGYAEDFEGFRDQAEDMTEDEIIECYLEYVREWAKENAQALIYNAIDEA